MIYCNNEEEESEIATTTESVSPPRTDENHPGFSSKARRSLFRLAMNEIEDAFNHMNAGKSFHMIFHTLSAVTLEVFFLFSFT